MIYFVFQISFLHQFYLRVVDAKKVLEFLGILKLFPETLTLNSVDPFIYVHYIVLYVLCTVYTITSKNIES